MSNFLSSYKSIAKHRDIRARVDVERGRLYLPKKWQGRRVSVRADGAIIASKSGALVNAQGFASIAKVSKQERQAIARALESKSKSKSAKAKASESVSESKSESKSESAK